MKKAIFFSVLLSLTALFGPKCYAYSVVVPTGQTIEFEVVNNKAWVTYHSSVSPAYPSLTGGLVLPDSILYYGVWCPVTRIGTNAFQGCSGLTFVQIPNSVTSIDFGAFSNCTGLTSVTLNNSLTDIGSNAFENCISLTSVTIPDGVEKILYKTFFNCSGLTSVNFGNGLDSIEWNAFESCIGLTSITLPSSLSYIGYEAFKDCTGLSSLTIPSGYIDANAFENCHSLSSVTFGSGVDTIKQFAFSNCIGLSSVEIPDGVRHLDYGVFQRCTGLTSATIGNGVSKLWSTFWRCTGLTSVTIGNGVDTIGDDTFLGCTALSTITGGNNVVAIGKQAFYECTSLTSFIVGNSVSLIDESAFNGCSGLTTVTLGNQLASIESNAFKNCTLLENIHCFATTPPSVKNNTFQGIPASAHIYVPCGSAYFYLQNTVWSQFDIAERHPFLLDITSAYPERGSVEIVTMPTCDNPVLEIQAMPATGYVFSHWSDQNNEAHRYIEVSQDIVLKAYFVQGNAVEETEAERITVFVSNGCIHVENAGEFSVFDVTGRQVCHILDANHTQPLPTGVYLVKAGDYPTQKVAIIK